MQNFKIRDETQARRSLDINLDIYQSSIQTEIGHCSLSLSQIPEICGIAYSLPCRTVVRIIVIVSYCKDR